MNVWTQFHRQQTYRRQKTYRRQRLFSVLVAVAAMASSFAPQAHGQQLPPSPFAFPRPRSQASPPVQVQTNPVPAQPVVRRTPTKAQLGRALMAEAYRRNAAHVAGLLAQGADPNTRDPAGIPALFYAAAVPDNETVVTLLLNKGAQVNAQDRRGNTVLAEAVQRGDSPLMALLLGRKADVNAGNRAGFTPLGIAAAKNDTPTVRLLLARGAHPAAQHGGVTPLLLAVQQGNLQAVRLLLDAGASVNPGVTSGPAPLPAAVASLRPAPGSAAREAILRELLEHECSGA